MTNTKQNKIDQLRIMVKALQDGVASAKTERDLYQELESRYKPHKMENYIYDREDMREEFLLEGWNALYRAKLDVGDPVTFAVNRGNFAMIDYYRKVGSEKLILVCKDCGHHMTYDRRNTACKKCYSTQLTSEEKEVLSEMSDFDTNFTSSDSFTTSVEIDEILSELIQLIEITDELSSTYKSLAVEALKNKERFYDYAKSTGKSHSFAIALEKKIQSFLGQFKDRFILV